MKIKGPNQVRKGHCIFSVLHKRGHGSMVMARAFDRGLLGLTCTFSCTYTHTHTYTHSHSHPHSHPPALKHLHLNTPPHHPANALSPALHMSTEPKANTHNATDSLSTEPKRTANSSTFCDSSEKSTVDHTHALSFPACSCSFTPGMTTNKCTSTKSKLAFKPPIRS